MESSGFEPPEPHSSLRSFIIFVSPFWRMPESPSNWVRKHLSTRQCCLNHVQCPSIQTTCKCRKPVFLFKSS